MGPILNPLLHKSPGTGTVSGMWTDRKVSIISHLEFTAHAGPKKKKKKKKNWIFFRRLSTRHLFRSHVVFPPSLPYSLYFFFSRDHAYRGHFFKQEECSPIPSRTYRTIPRPSPSTS
jgi:hypothetical protein